jgi:hypothetical protein
LSEDERPLSKVLQLLNHPHLETPISTSLFPIIPYVGVSQRLKFGSVPVDFSSSGLGLEGEILVTPISPEVVPWFRPRNSEDFLTLGFTTPPPVRVATFAEREAFVPSIPIDFSTNPLLFPFPPRKTPPVSPVRTPSPPNSPPPHIPMVSANPPRNRMDAIVAEIYDPLILPQPMNALPTRYYLKYMPKFIGKEDIIVEHLASFYSYEYNLNIKNEDVCMRVFV